MNEKEKSLNPQIAAWLDGGHVRDALLGQGKCFLADHTYRSHHDFTLAMSTFLKWSQLPANREHARQALATLCHSLLNESDHEALRDVVLAYDIMSRDLKIDIGLDVERWHQKLPDELRWRKTEPEN